MMVRSVFLLLFGVLTIKGDLGKSAIGVIYTIDIVPPRQSDDFDSFDKTIKNSAADMLLDHMLSDSHKLIPERLLNGGNRKSSDMPEEFKYFSRRKRDINGNPVNEAVSLRSFGSNSSSRPLPKSAPKFNVTFNLIANGTQAPIGGLPYPLPNVPLQLPFSPPRGPPKGFGNVSSPFRPPGSDPFGPSRPPFPSSYNSSGGAPVRPVSVNSQSGLFLQTNKQPYGFDVRPPRPSGSDFNPSNSSLYGTMGPGRVQQNLNSSLNTSTVGTWGLGPQRRPPQRPPPLRPPPLRPPSLRPPPLGTVDGLNSSWSVRPPGSDPNRLSRPLLSFHDRSSLSRTTPPLKSSLK